MARLGRRVPLQLQVTIELTGRMLPGTEIQAALAALDAMQVDVIGLNCATGPSEMGEPLRYLAASSRVPISCVPNAGLPSVVDGAMHYDLTPAQLAAYHHEFVTELGVSVIGGCCGTTPAHLEAVVERCAALRPVDREPTFEPAASSIYSQVPLHQDTSFLVVGERTNANGSKRFREAMLGGDWDTCVAMAKDQVKEGAHVIDVCVDYTGADGVSDMAEVARRFATQASVALMIDSTEGPVVARRPRLAGRPEHPQLRQPGGRRRRGHTPRHVPPPGPRVRRGRRVHLHRRGGPGAHGRLEGARRPGDPRRRRLPLRARARGPDLRPFGAAPVDRDGGEPARRDRDPRGDTPDQGGAARRLDHRRAVQRLLRTQPRSPPGAQLGISARGGRGGPRRSDRARVQDPAPRPYRRAGPRGLPRPRLRPPAGGLRPPGRAAHDL